MRRHGHEDAAADPPELDLEPLGHLRLFGRRRGRDAGEEAWSAILTGYKTAGPCSSPRASSSAGT